MSMFVKTPKFPKVFVVGSPESASVATMFEQEGYRLQTSPRTADIVCFTGGGDIAPARYGQTELHITRSSAASKDRDEAEIKCYNSLYPSQIKIGICRGGQLLNILNGGDMYQDVNYHNSGVTTHRILIKGEKQFRHVNSFHHQMMIPNFDDESLEVLGISATSTKRMKDDGLWEGTASFENHPDFEILWYGNSKSYCFQAHPEWAAQTRTVFFDVMKKIGIAHQ